MSARCAGNTLTTMFERVLIPNRGEIAVRIIRACRELGVKSVLAASSVDADSGLPARLADEVVRIGGPRPTDSYLNLQAILATAKALGVDAVHPGYGFLSEDRRLAEGCRDVGVTFIGPSPEVLENVGNKAIAREIAEAAGVPISPGRRLPLELSTDIVKELDSDLGFPLLIKAVHGGGGRGMRLVGEPDQFLELARAAAAEAAAAFGSPELYVEHWIARARHVEVQIMGLADGQVVVLGDRDCSVQRRHQKLIEEAPAPTLGETLRKQIHDAARSIGRLLNYESAGTVEFVLDEATGAFYFLEVNARLQVEHPVTEVVTGIDIVRTQFEIASRISVSPRVVQDPTARGAAIECRINAEVPAENFRPSPGRLTTWRPPTSSAVRLDTHCYGGYVVPPFYDSLIAKVIAFGHDRDDAIANMADALDSFEIAGVATTVSWAHGVITSQAFADATIHTRWVDEQGLAEA